MAFTRIVVASALLAILPAMACSAALDLTYTAPATEPLRTEPAAQSSSLFAIQPPPSLTLEYSCEGPQCQYETDIDKRHEDQTTRRWSIGIQ
ncbi:MAG: hypothetical protein ACK418_21040 [Pseudomonas sp.]|uniref:hypothetical protein n=1 Tax=Pseudomonas sp. TaxID=306 RepID=UPI00391975EB